MKAKGVCLFFGSVCHWVILILDGLCNDKRFVQKVDDSSRKVANKSLEDLYEVVAAVDVVLHLFHGQFSVCIDVLLECFDSR